MEWFKQWRRRRRREQSEDNFREIRRLARRIDEMHDLYRALVDNLPFGVAIHDTNDFVFINQQGAKLLGASSPYDIIGMPIRRFLDPDLLHTIEDRFNYVLREREPVKFMRQNVITLAGRPVEVAVMGAPVELSDSPYVQVIILTDISIRDFEEVQ